MRHPWALHRRSVGLTQESLADFLEVSRHMVIRLEQSLFPEPPPQLLNAISSLLEVSSSDLLNEYHSYATETRYSFRNEHRDFFSVLVNYRVDSLDMAPLVYYREAEGLTRMGLCKGLCLHQDSVRDYELNLQRSLPAQLIEAADLLDWNYSQLEELTQKWRIRWH